MRATYTFSKASIIADGLHISIAAKHIYSNSDTAFFNAAFDTIQRTIDLILCWERVAGNYPIDHDTVRVMVRNVSYGIIEDTAITISGKELEDISEMYYYYFGQMVNPDPDLDFWESMRSFGYSDTSHANFYIAKIAPLNVRKYTTEQHQRLKAWTKGDEILVENSSSEIQVFDLLGRFMRTSPGEKLDGFAPGMYFVVSGGESVRVLVDPQ